MGTDGITRLCGSTAYYIAHSKLYTNAEMTVFSDITNSTIHIIFSQL